jgi:Zn-dependent peptidase ImmA (M78 family)/transcriptional regulator with XRE-family HTH domain
MFSHRLRLARKRAGLSLRDLAERMDFEVSHQAIKKYEDGEMYPSSRVLVLLGRALGVSLDFLMSSQVQELAGVEFRQHSNTTKKDRAQVETAVIEATERYLEVEGALGLEGQVIDFGDIAQDTPLTSLAQAEERANQLRKHWDLGSDPMPSLTMLLEEKGFRVVLADLPNDVFGLSCSVQRENNLAPISVIVVGKNNYNIERRRFTLAHELAHALIPQVAEGMKKEAAMNRFAGAFLIPAEHLRIELGVGRRSFAYQEIIRLKQLYGVSAMSFLMRLRDLEMVSVEYVARAMRSYARTWRTKEPEPLQPNALAFKEVPMRFEQLVYRSLAERMVSLPRAAELLNISIAEVEIQIRGPAARHAD